MNTTLIALILCGLNSIALAQGRSTAGSEVIELTATHERNWLLNAGPAFGGGLQNNSVMFGASGGYQMDLQPRLAGRIVGEVALGGGADRSRVFNLGVGPTFYFTPNTGLHGRPYATADLGLASFRDNANHMADGVSLGAGLGYQFASRETYQLNAILHGTVLANRVGSDTPAIVAARIGVDL